MPHADSRLSRRHLFALSTFLVPLGVLAALGWMELQRSGHLAQAALEREARQFLVSARQSIEQQLELQVEPALAASMRTIAELGPVRATLALRERQFPSLEDIILLDEQASLVWPPLPPTGVSLPGVRNPARGTDSPTHRWLAAAELLAEHGRWPEACAHLREVIATLAQANPPGQQRRPDLEETELQARFRLAAILRAQGDADAAIEQFERVRLLARALMRRDNGDLAGIDLVAAAALAEMATPEQRLQVLTDITENHYDNVADGLAGAVAERLAATFADDDPHRAHVEELLVEERQRAATRSFAADYNLVLQYGVRLRRARSNTGRTGAEWLVSTLGDTTSLLALRPATADEAAEWQCSHVALHFDLRGLLGPALTPRGPLDSNFVLAADDPDNVPLLAPPSVVPDDFSPPTIESSGLTLRAYPAEPERMVQEARAANTKRTVLLFALFCTALGGALWSWRSVSREAELAALKIDLVSRVSHELKTPLALIRMYGETLGMGRARDIDQAAEFGSIIARESERLTTLIQRILDFSRQQAGTLDYATEEHDLGQLLRAVATAYAPHVESRGGLLIDHLPADILVRCDANAAESAVLNLLENALKYGPTDEEHEIELDLSRDHEHAIIEVRDRGRGIPPAERHRVFEGFYRASNAGEVRGAGLGLGLVRHFARAHGGDIEARPRPGGGTIMRLWLPLAECLQPTARGERRTP